MTLSETTYGWDKYHNMIFVDQPINTGFSYSNVSGFGGEAVGFSYSNVSGFGGRQWASATAM